MLKMTKEAQEKKSPSLDDLAEMLNNPLVLQAAEQKLRATGKIKDTPAKLEKKKIEPPKEVEFSEDDTPATLAKKFNEALKSRDEYWQDMLKEKEEALSEAIDSTSKQADADKVRSFVAKHPDIQSDPKLFAKVDQLFTAGASIEDAYADACKLLDIKPEEKSEEKKTQKTEPKESEAKKRSNLSSLDSEDDSKLSKEGIKDTREAAKQALKGLQASDPDKFAEIMGEKEEL
jgi:hypothetical protein